MALKYVRIGRKYRNIKTGDIYQAVALMMHSETPEAMVAYVKVHKTWRNIFGRLLMAVADKLLRHDQNIWSRPLTIFEEKFEEHPREIFGEDDTWGIY